MDRELREFLAGVRRRWMRLVALRTTARACAAAALPIILALAVDGALSLQGWPLILLTVSALIAAAAGVGVILRQRQRRPEDRRVARLVEERASAVTDMAPLGDELVSAVDASERKDSDANGFTALIVAAAARRVQSIDPAVVIDRATLRQAAVEGAAGVLALATALVLGAPGFGRTVQTAWIAAFPDTIRVHVAPGDARIAKGHRLQIRTTVRSRSGDLTGVTPSLTVTANNESRTVPMRKDGQEYRFDFASVDHTFRYRVSAGTAASSEYTVTALSPPRVERIDVRYVYPAYSGLTPREEENGGDLNAPAGTRVRLRIHADRAVTSGQLALTTTPSVALRPAGGAVLEADLTLARDDSYRVRLSDADGLRAESDTEYFIRLMDDRPPDVRIIRPSRDQQITPLEEVAIEARADDDYGVAALDLVYSVSGGPERVVRFPRVTGTDVQKVGSYLLPAENLGVQPGDVITYYARARDVGRGKRPTTAKSDMFFLEVKPFGEEFVAAQSQAGGGAGAGGMQIEALIAAQKEIINATWNVERRSAGGRSAADIKAIAQAQAELRARAEQLGRRGRGRGIREPFPQRAGDGVPPQAAPARREPADDPIAAALAAMAQAQQQLESQRTREAIAHEMSALNALLRAQAEVRRRQVSQQRANGAGGGGANRSGEDLSALFDRELQRQQRTNYETRSQVETRPERDASKDSALDRIRDLARRQEDLTRQQRELAGANVGAEELKRRLERLTREQAELRRQAEELAKQQGQQGAGRSAMRDASEQMRSAADDLRRQDAQAAAEKGERAAQALRSLERQVRGGSAGAQQASAERLQLDAQQIADAQRRIAAEAERLERDAGSNSSARRRLADEKGRLAGRVDDLQRAAKGDGHGEAAGELERGKIAERMRETARQLRDGARGTASAERQIERTLDRVVDQLGGKSDPDSRRLSDQLAQTRDIRERLNRLEAQMRAAEARQRQEGRGGRESGSARGSNGGRNGRSTETGRNGRGASAGGSGGGELERLRAEYQRELQRAREALGRLQQGEQRGADGATPEQHEYSRSAPGTEGFKQDRSQWELLRRNIDLALERHEAAVSKRLTRKDADDRLSGGGSDRVPDSYRDPIAKYFQSLAATGRRK